MKKKEEVTQDFWKLKKLGRPPIVSIIEAQTRGCGLLIQGHAKHLAGDPGLDDFKDAVHEL